METKRQLQQNNFESLSYMTQDPEALQAAIHILKKYAILPDRCDVIQDTSTLVVRLTETLVARVVQDLTGPRAGIEWFERENAIAAHLTFHQAPIIPLHPDLPPIAHLDAGYPVNFWQYICKKSADPIPQEIGSSLYQCHAALKSFSGQLSHLAILHESLELLHSRSDFSDSEHLLLRLHLNNSIQMLGQLPCQALHGDAHMGNLLQSSDRLLWTDWEDAFLGPIEWDLASIIWNAKILENDHSQVDAILSAYLRAGGNFQADSLHQCLIARAAVMCIWYPVLYPNPDVSRKTKLQERLNWLKHPTT